MIAAHIALAPAAIVLANGVDAPEYRVVLNGRHIHPKAKPAGLGGGLSLPLRYVSETLGANVSWDSGTKTALVSRGGAQKACQGEIAGGLMMAPVSFLADMFGAETSVNDKLGLIVMNTDGGSISDKEALALLPSYDGYGEEDLTWLAKIVEAEAQGETYASKLGVASVIINRRESGLYPSTIKGVIFDKKYGVQFTPTANGSVYNTPSGTSFMAAMEALEGRNNAPDTLFFMNPRLATNHWVPNNRQYAFTIGGHNYYY